MRFPLLSRDFVRETVRKEPLLCTYAGLRVLSDAFEAYRYGDSSLASTRRRIGFERWLYAVGGSDGGSGAKGGGGGGA